MMAVGAVNRGRSLATNRAALSGARIVVVEDLFLIASGIAEMLEEAGTVLFGPVELFCIERLEA